MRPSKPRDNSQTRGDPGEGASFDGLEDLPDIIEGIRAVVLVPVIASRSAQSSSHHVRSTAELAEGHGPSDRLQEAVGLSQAIDLDVVSQGLVRLQKIKPATLIGKGKVEELRGIIKAEEAELCIVDHPLSPVQQRNLEREWNVKVLDRTGLILEIFGRRARTKEGRLQVELAHLSYQKSRLVRSWTHLERQRGGFGFLGGPGETQIEADRRVIQDRISSIRKELETVKRTRELHREGRKRVPFPVVALVGYTNAGKSTLFNRLTGAQVHAQDQLFATLDPTMREVVLQSGQRIILSDTVGFISDLPTTLIAAFRATLEEVIEADLILHVRDISHERSDAQRADVLRVLKELGVDANSRKRDIIEVWNKADLLDDVGHEQIENSCARTGVGEDKDAVLVSSVTGEGVDDLLELIEHRLSAHQEVLNIEVAPTDGALVHWLYENTQVLERSDGEMGSTALTVRLPGPKLGQLKSMIGEGSQITMG